MWPLRTDRLLVHCFPVRKACSIPLLHPNVITGIAFVLSAAVIPLHLNHQYGWVVACAIGRQIADSFDGEVARTCGKTSKLGGLLDTIADAVFQFAAGFILASYFTRNTATRVVCAALLLAVFAGAMLLINTDMLYDHSYAKDFDKQPATAFMAENSVAIVLILSIAYLVFELRRHRA